MKIGVLIIGGILACLPVEVFAGTMDKWCAVDTRTGIRIQGVDAPIPFDVVEVQTCGKARVMKFQYSTTMNSCVMLVANPNNLDELYQLDVPCIPNVMQLAQK